MEVVFVGNLSFFCERSDLVNLFCQFGQINSAVVRKSKANEPLHYGFVELPSIGASAAVAQLQGKLFLGRKLRLSIDKARRPNDRNSLTSIHFSFLTHDTSERVDEAFICSAFSPYGELVDCVVKQYSASVDKQCGYGFLYYEEEATACLVLAAQAAQPVIKGVKFDCKLSSMSPVEAAEQSKRGRTSSSVSASSKGVSSVSAAVPQKQRNVHVDTPPIVDSNTSLHSQVPQTQQQQQSRSGDMIPSPPKLVVAPTLRVSSNSVSYNPSSSQENAKRQQVSSTHHSPQRNLPVPAHQVHSHASVAVPAQQPPLPHRNSNSQLSSQTSHVPPSHAPPSHASSSHASSSHTPASHVASSHAPSYLSPPLPHHHMVPTSDQYAPAAQQLPSTSPNTVPAMHYQTVSWHSPPVPAPPQTLVQHHFRPLPPHQQFQQQQFAATSLHPGIGYSTFVQQMPHNGAVYPGNAILYAHPNQQGVYMHPAPAHYPMTAGYPLISPTIPVQQQHFTQHIPHNPQSFVTAPTSSTSPPTSTSTSPTPTVLPGTHPYSHGSAVSYPPHHS